MKQAIYYMEKPINKKRIIFVCAENAGRSKMAEAFFNTIAQKKHLDWIAESAGTFPAHKINPVVAQTMEEIGITIQDTPPKLFLSERAPKYSHIISFGCIVKSAFSQEIQKRIEEWHIEDPKDKPLTEVRVIRNEVEKYVNNLLNIL